LTSGKETCNADENRRNIQWRIEFRPTRFCGYKKIVWNEPTMGYKLRSAFKVGIIRMELVVCGV